MNKEEKWFALPILLGIMEKGQDKHKICWEKKRMGDVYQSLVHRFWNSLRQALQRLPNLEVEEIPCLVLILFQRGTSLIIVPSGPWLSFWKVLSHLFTLDAHIRQRLWWISLLWSVCSFLCPFLCEGCVYACITFSKLGFLKPTSWFLWQFHLNFDNFRSNIFSKFWMLLWLTQIFPRCTS